MPPRKSRKNKDSVTQLPGGALQTTFAVQDKPDLTTDQSNQAQIPRGRRQPVATKYSGLDAPDSAALSGPGRDFQPAAAAPTIHPATEQPATRANLDNSQAQAPDRPQPIRKPSKRQQKLDASAPLTSAPAKKMKGRFHVPRTPVPPMSTFASQQIQDSQNRRAAAVLFTPRTKGHSAHLQLRQQQQSPTPYQRSAEPSALRDLAGTGGGDSDTEEDIRAGIERLNLEPHSSSGSRSPQAEPHSKRRKAAARSKGGAKDVWQFFRKDDKRHICILCEQVKSANPAHQISTFGTTTSTSNLRKHLFTDHIEQWSAACQDLNIAITAEAAKEAIRQFRQEPAVTPLETERPKYSKEAFVDAIVDFVVGDDQALNVVESPRLRKIFLLLRQELKESDIPGRTTIRKQVGKAYEDYLHQLEADLSKSVGKISFTTDTWSDPNQSSFMAVTAHWMEATEEKTAAGSQRKLSLRADLIGFHNLPGRHTGEHLGHCFLYVLDRIKITSKIGWVTCDNASNNHSMMECLQNLLQKRRIRFDSTEMRIRCFPHIVNLACKAVLTAITNIKYVDDTAELYEDYQPSAFSNDCIATVRSLVNAIRNSNLKKQRFSEYVQRSSDQNYQLLRDVATRWSSTLLMISRVLKLREAIEDITHDNEFRDLFKFRLSEDDWALLETYQEILQVPHAFQEILSGENTPTICYAIPAFASFIQVWKHLIREQPDWEDIIQPGLNKLEDYQDMLTDTHIVAMAIDPKNKLGYYRAQSPAEFESAKRVFLKVLRSHSASNKAPSAQPVRAAAPKVSRPTAADILRLNQPHPIARQTISLEMEVDQYLSDLNSGTGTIEFWQEHQQRYPRIFSLAMDIIPIQASSVPCERVFSSGKETMAPRRRRISPQLMESLQILKYSIRKGRPLNFTQGMSWSDELKEFEYAAQVAPLGDAEAYGRSLEGLAEDSDELEEMLENLEKQLEELEEIVEESADNGDDEDDIENEELYYYD